MTTRYPGGLIRKTPPTITPPVDGEGGSAPGVWTLEQASYYTKQGTWPLPLKSGSLFTWGINNQGELAQNNQVYRSSPTQVGAQTSWKTVVSGTENCMFATQVNGTLWAWGNNQNGQLGINLVGSADRSSPVQIGALTNWSSVSAGKEFALAIKTDGTLWAWGINDYGLLAQNLNPTELVLKSSPVQVGSDTNWYQAAAGDQAGYAIKTNGTIWAWGRGINGSLGIDLSSGDRSSPVQIGALTNWSKVFGGLYRAMAIKTDGTLWLWGAGSYGALGTGNSIYRSSPTQIGALTNWASGALNEYHNFAVKTDGTLWAWGKNNAGQLGLNNTVSCSSPVQVGNLTNWSKTGAGRDQGYGLKTDGTLWSWGSNTSGQLGQNNTTAISSPVQIGSLTSWFFISPDPSGGVGAIKS